MTDTDTRDVAGRVLIGEEVRRAGYNHAEQKPIEEMFPLLDAVLDTPGVHSIRWTQDIPSFNDGEPCLFSTNEYTVRMLRGDETPPTHARLKADADDDRDGDLEDENFDYRNGYRDSYDLRHSIPDHPVLMAFDALTSKTAHFEDAVQQAFGDYAEVTAYKDSQTGEYGFHVGEHEASY